MPIARPSPVRIARCGVIRSSPDAPTWIATFLPDTSTSSPRASASFSPELVHAARNRAARTPSPARCAARNITLVRPHLPLLHELARRRPALPADAAADMESSTRHRLGVALRRRLPRLLRTRLVGACRRRTARAVADPIARATSPHRRRSHRVGAPWPSCPFRAQPPGNSRTRSGCRTARLTSGSRRPSRCCRRGGASRRPASRCAARPTAAARTRCSLTRRRTAPGCSTTSGRSPTAPR